MLVFQEEWENKKTGTGMWIGASISVVEMIIMPRSPKELLNENLVISVPSESESVEPKPGENESVDPKLADSKPVDSKLLKLP